MKQTKIPIHEIWYFKLENCKNRVQIDRWSSWHCSSSANWLQIVWNISFYFKILRHSKVALFCQNYSKLTFTVISWNTYRSSKFPFHCLSRQTVVRNHDRKHFRSSQLYTIPYESPILGQLLDLISLAKINLFEPRFKSYDPWDMANCLP